MQELDWANLSQYKNDNLKIGSPLEGEKRIIFMGDSITEQWLEIVPEYFSNKNYINRGIGGQTTPQMLLRFRNDVIKLKPKAVHILAGTNDIAGNTGPVTLDMIMDNIISMTELAIVNKIKVILCSVLPVYDYPWAPGLKPAEKIKKLNKIISDYAMSKEEILYVNYYSKMADDIGGLKKELTTDGVHLTRIGYEIMIPLVEEMISKVLDMS